VIPYLLQLGSASQRRRVRTVFYLDLLVRMASKSEAEIDTRIYGYLKQRCRERHVWSAVRKASARRTYEHRLFLRNAIAQRKRKDINTQVRSLLTTGLIVKILASRYAVKGFRRNQTEAYFYLVDAYESVPAISADGRRSRDYWRECKPIASLCAALIDFLMQRTGALRIDRQTLQSLKADMAAFLRTAYEYQKFLLGEDDAIQPTLSVSAIRRINVKRLPPIECGRSYRTPKLPRWGRKSDV
jgi:hypothetical protein